jgi:hypothetical protein
VSDPEKNSIIERTRWEGVPHDKVFEWVAGTPGSGQGRRTTESLHSTAAELAGNQDHLAEALGHAEAALDEYTAASAGTAADAGARSIAGAVIWLRTLTQNAAVVPEVMGSVAERFDQARGVIDGAPPNPVPRYDSAPDNLQLSWMIPPPADQADHNEAEARRQVRDAMAGYQDDAIAQLYRLPRFERPPSAGPPPPSPPAPATRPAEAPAEATVPIRRGVVPLGYGPVGHDADDSRFDVERTDRLPPAQQAPARRRPLSRPEPAQPPVMRGPSTSSFFEPDEAVAPPVIGERTERS